MAITNFDIIEANDITVNGNSAVPIRESIELTVAADGDPAGVDDFDTFEEAVAWASTQSTAGSSSVTLLLADGQHIISDIHTDSNEAYNISDITLFFKSASEDKSLCTITLATGSLAEYLWFTVFYRSKVAFENITVDPQANGSATAKLTTWFNVFENSTLYVTGSTLTNMQQAVFCLDGGQAIISNTEISYCSTAGIRLTRDCFIQLENTITIDNCARGIYIESLSRGQVYYTGAVTISNSSVDAIRIFQSTFTAGTGSFTLTTNTEDTNIPINEIQYDGTYISDGTAALTFKA